MTYPLGVVLLELVGQVLEKNADLHKVVKADRARAGAVKLVDDEADEVGGQVVAKALQAGGKLLVVDRVAAIYVGEKGAMWGGKV